MQPGCECNQVLNALGVGAKSSWWISKILDLKIPLMELDILNGNIKQENESLKEQNHLEKVITDNNHLHLVICYKMNKKLKKRNS